MIAPEQVYAALLISSSHTRADGQQFTLRYGAGGRAGYGGLLTTMAYFDTAADSARSATLRAATPPHAVRAVTRDGCC